MGHANDGEPIAHEQAMELANEWVDAWYNRDIDAIMSHFDEKDIEFHSPLIATLAGSEDGVLLDTTDLKQYFMSGLDKYPQIHFQLKEVLTGKDSVAVYYQSVKDLMACEIMFLNDKGKVYKVLNHYRAQDQDNTNKEGVGMKWIDAWNSATLDAFVKDCLDGDNVELVSPFVPKITGQPRLVGAQQLLNYYQGVLTKYPSLNFKLLDILQGNGSVAVYYESVNGAKECVVMHLNKDGKVDRIWNHSCSS